MSKRLQLHFVMKNHVPSSNHRVRFRWIPSLLLFAGVLIPHAQAQELEASDGVAVDDLFANYVGISGTTAVVGAYGDDTASGSAYVFRDLDTANGTITQNVKLRASDAAANDRFGYGVGISGTTAIVGAWGNEEPYSESGTAYVFRDLDTASGTITQNVILRASDAASSGSEDLFGWSVGISGTTAIVGAKGGEFHAISPGSAYVFRDLDTASGTITQNVKLTASDGATGERFGYTVGISGTTAIVGEAGDRSPGSNSGSAYVFRDLDTAGGAITENVKLTASDAATGDFFATAVGISGTTAVVGAHGNTDNGYNSGSAYVFRELDTASGTITENLKLAASDGAASQNFGIAVGISGTTAIVGAYGDNDKAFFAGAAYLFQNLGTGSGSITESLKITASDGETTDKFGVSVGIEGDYFVVGATLGDGVVADSGKAYSGTVSSLTTLDTGSTSRTIDGISFASRDDWIIGQNTDSNQVTLAAGDTGTVSSASKAVHVGQNAGSDNNTLSIGGTLTANQINVGATGNTGNSLVIDGSVTAPVSVASGSEVSGSGTLNGLLTLSSGAIFSPGNSPGMLTLTSGLTLEASSVLNFELGAPSGTAGVDSDLIMITGGSLTGPSSGLVTVYFTDAGSFGVGTYDLINYASATLSNFEATDFTVGSGIAGYDFSFGLSSNILQVTTSVSAVPEPSTYAVIFGAIALGGAACRRRRAGRN